MADIELVIRISIYDKEWITNGYYIPEEINMRISEAIANGTVLPKGHGDLIDRSKIYKAIYAEEDNCTGMGMTLEEMDTYNDGIDAMYSLINSAPTIIPADKDGD